jgi:hypothetical protein
VITDPGLQFLYDRWLVRRQGRKMPSRADFDPVELPVRLWPHITLADVLREDGVLRFRYRRVGAVFVGGFGRDPTGSYFDEALEGEFGAYIVGLYEEVVARSKPIYSVNISVRDGEAQIHRVTRRLILPLSRNGSEVDMTLAGHIIEKASTQDLPLRWPEFREELRLVLGD